MWVNLLRRLVLQILIGLFAGGFGGLGCCFFAFSNLSKNFPRKLDRGPAPALPVLQSWIPGLTSWLLLLCMNI